MKKEEESTVQMEWLTSIDSTTLTHSELQALSLSSLSSFDLKSTREIVTPKIDPSTFNHSAGSHRTYSRPHRRCRVAPPLLPTPTLPSDHRIIIDYLKQFIREDPKFDTVELRNPSIPEVKEFPLALPGGEVRKRKRGRKPKVKTHLEEEIVNKNGVVIDLAALSEVEHPFAAEIARRTEGLKEEEELLGFLSDLVGQWGSRRRKRRIVDASDFGDVLPLGWKLLLSLKRKDGRAWIYCRRYISPNGQQFLSCKEVSSYLQSLFGHTDTQLQITQRSENVLPEQRVTTENVSTPAAASVAREEQDQRQIVATNSNVSGLSVSNERFKEIALLEMENLADVQIHDLFECHKCSLTFDEKDAYLQHLLSIHQKTTRRYRLGSSVSDGVIIKDGKFECQFCHKVFLEKRRYNSHVGIHVRNYLRRAEDLPGQPNVLGAEESPVTDETPSRITKMDALIEIAQNSIIEDSIMEPSSTLNTIPVSEIAVGDLDEDINAESPVGEQKMEKSLTGTNVVSDLNQQGSPRLPMDGTIEEIDANNRVVDAKMVSFLDNTGLLSVNKKNVDAPDTSEGKGDVALTVEGFDHSGSELQGASQSPLLHSSGNHMKPGSKKSENSGCTNTKGDLKFDEDSSNKSDLKIGLDSCYDVPGVSNVHVTAMPTSKENVVQSKVSNPSVSPEQSLDSFSAFSSDKGFQELRLEDISSLEYDFASVQGSLDVSTELANDIVVQGTCASSAQSASQEVTLNMDYKNQLTTTCVWCGIEFNHDAVNSEIQSDSVGFMCPVCKAKISGQINVLDSGSPNAGHL